MKKLTALLLALLVLALPVMGMAASPNELFNQAAENHAYTTNGVLTWGNTSLLDDDTQSLLKDVVDAISFTRSVQENQTDFALKLSGADVLTLSTASAGEDTYILSNLLGGTVAFNDAEGQVIADYLMKYAVSSGMMTEDDVAQVKASIQQAMEQTETAAADVDLSSFDTTAITAWAEKFLSSVTIEEVAQQPKNSDPAATVISFTLTGEDVTELYTIIFDALKDNEAFMAGLTSATLTMDGESVTAEEFVAKLPEMAKKIGDAVQGDIPVNLYMDADGNPVYAAVTMTMKLEDEGDTETITMGVDYARLTVADGVTHAFNIIGTDADNNGVAISVSVLNGEKLFTINAGIGTITDGVTETIMGLDVNAQKDYGDTEATLDVDAVLTIMDDDAEIPMGIKLVKTARLDGENATYEGDLDLLLLGEKVLCLQMTAATGEAAPTIVTAEAVRPGQMTEEDFNAYLENDVMLALQTALINLIQNLPASVLSLLMGQ